MSSHLRLALFSVAATPLLAAPAPKADLPAGLELVVAAAPPLVRHPILGCLDDRGRLFIGDSSGVNWNQEQLDKDPPHRVLLLEDADGDGVFDRSTVFADRMTFPQGACWLGGSLYVASPPGIWRLTDSDGDGIADRRELIVGGFEHTGNAADVHGPFLHPTNGRLYWCHGRKGHAVKRRDGSLVHAGKAAGIWSCLPDGEDVQWHALGCMDNPVEVEFLPDGDIIGVVNLHYNQPRGDTLVHWLPGGVYERPDLPDVIADLPRTLDRMPVVHNYGHVAVSGFTRYRSGTLDPSWRNDLFVTFFNTQKVVRTRLIPEGSTYGATTHEFLKVHDPNVHLTDVIEDRDGSLLVLDTGGWFRRGCPSSLEERPDIRGAVYRVRARGARRTPATSPAEPPVPAVPLAAAREPRDLRRALESIAAARVITPGDQTLLARLLAQPLDPALEHAAMYAALVTGTFGLDHLRTASTPAARRRLLRILEQTLPAGDGRDALLLAALAFATGADADLAGAACAVLARNADSPRRFAAEFTRLLAGASVEAAALRLLTTVLAAAPASPDAAPLVTRMLEHRAAEVRRAAWSMLARTRTDVPPAAWGAALERNLGEAAPGDLPALLEALAHVPDPRFRPALTRYAADPSRPATLRVRALGATVRPGETVAEATFAALLALAGDAASPAARADAARLLGRSNLSDAQVRAAAPLLATSNPVEIGELLKAVRRRTDPETGRVCAAELLRSPFLGTIEESAIRSAFSGFPARVVEETLLPAVRAAAAADDSRRRRLEDLASAATRGRPGEGRRLWAESSCQSCHSAGGMGAAIGPDLSRIGAARTARDILESILFPDATLVRDFETHLIETAGGEVHAGRLLREDRGAVTLVDAAGNLQSLPLASVVGRGISPRSLMPVGLELAMSEQQLLDLVAWLTSLR